MEVLFCGIPNGRTQKVQHQAAHRLLNWQLYQRGCTDFTMEYGRLGKPSLQAYPQLPFNLSHANGICVSAVGSFPMGVDVEPIRPLRPKVIRRICTEEERQLIAQASNPDEAFFRIWTLKESYVKAIGIGVSYPMQTIALHLEGAAISSNLPGYRFVQYVLQNRYVLALCTTAPPEEPIHLLATSLERIPILAETETAHPVP